MSGRSDSRSLIGPILIGTLLQLAMVISGHSHTSVAVLFPFLGTAFGGVAGLLTTLNAAAGPRPAAVMGALSGGATGLLGTLVSFVLGDIPAFTIVVGTAAAAAGGALGALAGRLLGNRGGV